jgi:hypothetical protein
MPTGPPHGLPEDDDDTHAEEGVDADNLDDLFPEEEQGVDDDFYNPDDIDNLVSSFQNDVDTDDQGEEKREYGALMPGEVMEI